MTDLKPEDIKVGLEVAVYTEFDRSWGVHGTHQLVAGEVVRVAAKSFVVKTGNRELRFKFDTMRFRESGGGYWSTTWLVDKPTSGRVQELLVQRKLSNLQNEAHKFVDEWLASRGDLEKAIAAASRLNKYVEERKYHG